MPLKQASLNLSSRLSEKMFEEVAEESFRQDIEIKVIISARNLTMLEKKALEKGLSSQVMIIRILHKFASV